MSAPIHVVAGVVQDVGGRILLARRTAGRDLAGLWEFPGGKVEPKESPQQALQRELLEELGIHIGAITPLICVPQTYPNKHIVLDVYGVKSFAGKPRGLERQALAWVPPNKLPDYAMPPADRPVVAALLASDSYAISPELADDAALMVWMTRALAAGHRRVQLRLKQAPLERVETVARAMQPLCAAASAELFINGHQQIAGKLGLGVHLTAQQLVSLTQRPLAAGLPWAASCHNAEELLRAQDLGADFTVLGPIAPTASHLDARLLGWDGFAELRAGVSLPIYALGGVTRADLSQARRVGAQGIAGIRAFT